MSHNAFYGTLRNTNSSASKRSVQSARSTSNQPNTLINYQKREKLRNLLITKFMKKYNLKINEPFIDEEVKNFLRKETLTDNDLQRLDQRIFEMIQKKYSLNQLETNLRNESLTNQGELEAYNEKASTYSKRVQTAYNKTIDEGNMSVHSGMSGASKLSKAKFNRHKDLTDEELDLLSVVSQHEQIERINFGNEKDEWDAINKYNQKVFEEDRKVENMKDKEIKRRTKEDLDNQIKQKMYLQNEERMKNKEYDKITIDHVNVLNKMEEAKQKAIRDKKIREKENRDSQRLDEMKRKRIEELKNRKYEKELSKYFIKSNTSMKKLTKKNKMLLKRKWKKMKP